MTTQQRIERIAREAADWAERVYDGSCHLAHYVTKQAVLHALTAFAEEQEKWQQEMWRPVKDRPAYEVSNLGRVRTTVGERILGQWPNQDGYMLVRLSNPRGMARVHRLVAEAFIQNPEGKPCVNHIDCVPDNNAATNLEWCTQKENIAHSDKLGRMQRNYWTGKKSPNAKLSDETVREMRRMYDSGEFSIESVGKLFGVSKRTAGRIINEEVYKYVR